MGEREINVTLTYTEEEAREVARAFLYFTSNVSATHEDHDRMTLIRSAIQTALPKPKPEEPTGLGAVVEDAEGARWTRSIVGGNVTPTWSESLSGARRVYGDIAAIRVLSEGVQAGDPA